jgi:hypothetical protein
VVSKTYTFIDGSIAGLTDPSKSLTVDFFSTVSTAVLVWSVSGGNFQQIRFNSNIISNERSGQVNVLSHLKNGLSNNVKVDMGAALALPSANVVLKVDGVIATYDIIYAWITNGTNAFKAGTVTNVDEFKAWCNQQLAYANTMLQHGLITSKQYQTLASMVTDALKPVNAVPDVPSGGDNNQGGFWDWLNGASGDVGFMWTGKNIAIIAGLLLVAFVLLFVIFKRGAN